MNDLFKKKEELNKLIEQQKILELDIEEIEEKNRKLNSKNLCEHIDVYFNEFYGKQLIDVKKFFAHGKYNRYLNEIKVFDVELCNSLSSNRWKNEMGIIKPGVPIKYLYELKKLINDKHLSNEIDKMINEQVSPEFKLLRVFSEIIKQQQKDINNLVSSIFTDKQ